MKLKNLIEEYSGNGFVLEDNGNGASMGMRFIELGEDLMAEYGDTEMYELNELCVSDDDVECRYASDWMVKGQGDNPYRVRIFF